MLHRESEEFWPSHWGHEHRIEHALHEIIVNQQTEIHLLRKLLEPKPVASFIITQKGDSPMPTQGPLTGLAPGATGTFTATPIDPSQNQTNLPSGDVLVWTSDDPSDVITLNGDGSIATVVVNPAAVAGSTHNLSVALPPTTTNPLGPVSSAAPLPVLGGTTTQPVAGFVITQN